MVRFRLTILRLRESSVEKNLGRSTILRSREFWGKRTAAAIWSRRRVGGSVTTIIATKRFNEGKEERV